MWHNDWVNQGWPIEFTWCVNAGNCRLFTFTLIYSHLHFGTCRICWSDNHPRNICAMFWRKVCDQDNFPGFPTIMDRLLMAVQLPADTWHRTLVMYKENIIQWITYMTVPRVINIPTIVPRTSGHESITPWSHLLTIGVGLSTMWQWPRLVSGWEMWILLRSFAVWMRLR